jgi:hypothetical protein
MTQWQTLEAALRKHGFLSGAVTKEDEMAIDALLKDVRTMFDDEALAKDRLSALPTDNGR